MVQISKQEWVEQVRSWSPHYPKGTLQLLGMLSQAGFHLVQDGQDFMEAAVEQVVLAELELNPQIGPCEVEGCYGSVCVCGQQFDDSGHKVFWQHPSYGYSVCGRGCAEEFVGVML